MSWESLPLLVYRPLQQGEIRILRLETGPDLRLSLQHQRLDDQLFFTAVSYTWGPETPQADLVIDGQILRVRKALVSMIKALSRDKSPKRDLWIDAICINQNDTQEQNHQVKIMGSIYSRATHVIVYLGFNTRSSVRAQLVKWAYNIGATSDAIFPSSRSPSRVQAILPILSNKYFTRRWIIQEFGLARELDIHYRGGRVTLAELERLARADREASSIYSSAAHLCELRQDMRANSRTLEKLLYDYENAACSRYQDKIYALLSLSRQARYHLPVDYGLDCLELLLVVVDTCSKYEDLHPLRTISFSCFLYQHLEITWRHIILHIQRQSFKHLADTTTFVASALSRGVVLDHLGGQEHFVTRLRRHLPTLRRYAPVDLYRHVTGSVVPHRPVVSFGQSNQHLPIADISSSEQWSFATESGSIHNRSCSCVGLGTAVTQRNDEVWQFPRVPLALILRPTTSGYSMIGRAQLLTKQERAEGGIEDLLDWNRGDMEELRETDPVMNFVMTPGQLMQMWHWTNFDQYTVGLEG